MVHASTGNFYKYGLSSPPLVWTGSPIRSSMWDPHGGRNLGILLAVGCIWRFALVCIKNKPHPIIVTLSSRAYNHSPIEWDVELIHPIVYVYSDRCKLVGLVSDYRIDFGWSTRMDQRWAPHMLMRGSYPHSGQTNLIVVIRASDCIQKRQFESLKGNETFSFFFFLGKTTRVLRKSLLLACCLVTYKYKNDLISQ